MLTCEKSRCVDYLTVDELIQELLNRKTFKGLIVKTDDENLFSVSQTNLSTQQLSAALKKALEWVQTHAPLIATVIICNV